MYFLVLKDELGNAVLVLQGLHNKITELYDTTDDFRIFFDSMMVSIQSGTDS